MDREGSGGDREDPEALRVWVGLAEACCDGWSIGQRLENAGASGLRGRRVCLSAGEYMETVCTLSSGLLGGSKERFPRGDRKVGLWVSSLLQLAPQTPAIWLLCVACWDSIYFFLQFC